MGTTGVAGEPGAKGSPAGALWTVGLGAFLLVAAAATFVAVRWDQIPDGAKLGALLTVTALCVGARARLRATLPITAAALFHVGVLLVPIDVAALGVRAGWEWPRMLFALGLTATMAFGVGAHVERSVVLRWATWGAVVALAGGTGAVTDLPAALLLATAALLGAVAAPRSRLGDSLESGAAGWALLAGYATPLALAGVDRTSSAEVLTALGLVGEGSPAGTAWLTGLLSALALGVVGARHRHPLTVLAGVGAALVGTLTTWATLSLDDGTDVLLVALAALAAQAAHRARRDDPFWGGVTGVVAEVAMVPTILLTLLFTGFVLLTPVLDDALPSPVEGLAAAVVAVTWLVTASRLVSGGRSLTAMAATGAAAITLFVGHQEVAAPATLAVLAATALLLAPRWSGANAPGDQIVAGLLLAAAPLVAYETDLVALAVGLGGGLALAEAAVRSSRQRAAGRRYAGAAASVLAGWSLVPPALAAMVAHTDVDGWRSLGLVVTAWLLALVLDRAEQVPGREPLGALPRVAMVAALATTLDLNPAGAAGVAGVVAGLLLFDALRRSEPVFLVGVGTAVPMALAHLVLAAGWTTAAASLVVTGSALVWLGLAGCLPGRWAPPALVAAAIGVGAGLCLGTVDAAAFSADLVLVGVGVALVGLVVAQPDIALAGGGIATVGTWGLLGAYDVTAVDAYVAPLAVVLLGVGLVARRGGAPEPGAGSGEPGTGLSSWAALAPPVALLGGAAVLERLQGGSPWHAAVAGAVGVLAVAAGAVGRWAGPLFTGTALVVAVTAHETLGVTAQLPTWVWLATGGVTLLAAGVAMERRGVGPVETGRRLVDVVAERFD